MKPHPNQPVTITLGACGHSNGPYSDIAATMAIMKARGLTTYRFDLNLTSDQNPAALLDALLAQATPNGVTLRPIIQIPFSYGDATDGGTYPNTLAGLTSQAHDRCHAIMDVYGDRIKRWEFSNELTLKSGIKTNGSTGELAAHYNTTLGNQWAACYKGFTNAATEINTAKSWGLQRMIDIVYVDFGFVPFLEANGGIVDVLAYHYYYLWTTSPYFISAPDRILDLFEELGNIGKPVVINEFNAAEIYNPGRVPPVAYDDTKAMLGLATHLQYIFGQTECDIQGVEFYELFNEPAKLPDPVESNFGLMQSSTVLKNQILLANLYSGKTMTTADLQAIQALAVLWRPR